MKKLYYILIAVGIVAFILVMNKACQAPQGKGFKADSFAHEVRRVEVVDGTQKITYKDQSSMSFSGLNLDNPNMKQYEGMNFSEFIYPGDSIYKEAESLILTVKPVEGEVFELDVN